MKTKWIQTSTGCYMQIIVPTESGWYEFQVPTMDEMIEAGTRYMIARYREANDDPTSSG